MPDPALPSVQPPGRLAGVGIRPRFRIGHLPSIAVAGAITVEGIAVALAMLAADLAPLLWLALPLIGIGCASLYAITAKQRELGAAALTAIAAEGCVFGLLALAIVSG